MKVSRFFPTVAIAFALIFIFGAYYYNRWYHNNIHSHPKMYAYQTYWGPPNSVLIIEDAKYGDALIKYYHTISTDPKTNPPIEVPLKTIPVYEPVYVMDYTQDSMLAEVVSYYNRGQYFGGNYLRGWVYKATLHNSPPSNSP